MINAIVISIVFFINSISAKEGASEVHQSHNSQVVGNALTIYKDKCLATLKFKSTGVRKFSLFKVPDSVDPQSILFKVNQNLPQYYLKKSDQDSGNELVIYHDENSVLEGEVSYIFSGISWHMHYSMEINSALDKILNFNGFISVDNQNNNEFESADLHFVDAKTDSLTKNQKFNEYCVQGKRFIPKKVSVKIPWIGMNSQDCTHDYRLDVGRDNLKDFNGGEKIVPLQVWLTFNNTLENKQSIASGDVEIYIRDKENLKYVGGSVLTPVGEGGDTIRLGLPSSLLTQISSNTNSPISKIKGTLEQTEFKVLLADKISEAAYRLNIKNSGEKEISIKVVLPFDKMQGKIIRENMEHQKESGSTIYWPIKVKPKSEVVLRYRVQLTQKG